MDKKTIIKLNIIRLLCIISLVITGLSIRDTYAKYYERADVNYEINIKRWLITVNDIDILEKEEYTQIFIPTFETSEYVNDDVIVPGREGYFDLDIDYTNVDLSFEIDLEIEQITQEENELLDFKVLKVVEIDSENEETPVTFPYVINIEESEETEKHLRAYFCWDDSEENLMTDEDDTSYEGETEQGNDHTVVKCRATLVFSQYILVEEGGD